MSVLPPTKLEQIQFCESHIPIWAAAPAAIGLVAAQVTLLDNATKAARTSYTANQNARQAAKASTTTYTGNTGAMRDIAADLIRVIKSFAELQQNPATVFGLAQIPEPAAPTPAPAPGKPTNIAVNLEPSGAVTVSWDCTDSAASSGAFFNITRKLPGAGAFSFFTSANGSTSATRRMSFTDNTVPTSAAGVGVQYIITGQRGILHGESSDAITVQFGQEGGGLTVTSSAGASFKMAA